MKTFLALCWLNTFLCFGITNSITLAEMARVSSSNYPVQIGRPFLQGEIANYPQALVDGTAVIRRANATGRSELRFLSAENSVGPSHADCRSMHLLDFRAGGNDRHHSRSVAVR